MILTTQFISSIFYHKHVFYGACGSKIERLGADSFGRTLPSMSETIGSIPW